MTFTVIGLNGHGGLLNSLYAKVRAAIVLKENNNMNPFLFIGILILIGLFLDWWDDNQYKFRDWLMDFEGAIGKKLGYVVVDCFMEHSGLSFRERIVLPKGITDEGIREASRQHAQKFIKEHKLESKSVTWHWKKA